jgi:recombination protein RecT
MNTSTNTDLAEFLDKAENKFEYAPVGMKFEKEKGFALQIFSTNEFLYKTALNNPASLLYAMTNVASVGLSLNPAKKQAYLVPRKGVICFDPSYMGMCDLATQSERIEFVQAKIVCANDKYTNRGTDKDPVHEYDPFKERGEIVGAYCVAKTNSGDYLTTEMSKEKIDAVRDRSELWKRSKSGPWQTDYEEMAKKTVVRNAFKMWPKTETMERLEMAVDISNQNEQFEPIVNSPELHDYSPQQKEYLDNLITNSDAIGMYCFMTQLEEGTQASLYNSFEQGTITKFKAIVSKLISEGQSKIADIQIVIEEAADSGDDLAAKELLQDMSQESIDFLKQNSDDEIRQFIQECLTEEAA